MESSKQPHLFETIFCNIINVFTITFDQFFLLNKYINNKKEAFYRPQHTAFFLNDIIMRIFPVLYLHKHPVLICLNSNRSDLCCLCQIHMNECWTSAEH